MLYVIAVKVRTHIKMNTGHCIGCEITTQKQLISSIWFKILNVKQVALRLSPSSPGVLG